MGQRNYYNFMALFILRESGKTVNRAKASGVAYKLYKNSRMIVG